MAESIKMVMGYKELFLKGLGYTMMVSVEAPGYAEGKLRRLS